MSLLPKTAPLPAGQKGPGRPIFTLRISRRGRSLPLQLGQAASFPDALATWVAIASIKAGDRQS
jgi:hypothetical protein